MASVPECALMTWNPWADSCISYIAATSTSSSTSSNRIPSDPSGMDSPRWPFTSARQTKRECTPFARSGRDLNIPALGLSPSAREVEAGAGALNTRGDRALEAPERLKQLRQVFLGDPVTVIGDV